MPSTLTLKVILLTLITACIPSLSFSTTIVELDVKALTRASHKIITGTVIDQRSSWDSQGQMITTYSTIRIDQVVRGKALKDQTLVVAQPGGSVGDTTQMIHGMTYLRQDDRLLLFLEEQPDSTVHKVTGLTQGIYRIHRDPHGNLMATPTQRRSHAKFVTPVGRSTINLRTRRGAQPLQELLDEVRASQ